MDERNIEQLCGYPPCSIPQGPQPRQKYHISLAQKKVFDLTQRKVGHTFSTEGRVVDECIMFDRNSVVWSATEHQITMHHNWQQLRQQIESKHSFRF